MITESGTCDNSDENKIRINHLLYSLQCIKMGIKDNIPIIGYCYWTLTDNFEWEDGFFPRFGLYKVDYDIVKQQHKNSSLHDQSRTITKGGELYKHIIKINKTL